MKLPNAASIVPRSLLGAGLAVFGLASTGVSTAQVVITPAGVLASRTNSSSQTPVNLINTAGLLGSGSILTQTVSNNASALNMWETGVVDVSTNWVQFDLGAQFNLTGAAIWQFNMTNATERGVQTFGVFVSSNSTANSATNFVGSFTLNRGSGTVNEGVQQIAFATNFVRLIRFNVSNTFAANNITNCGLSKARFLGSPSSPVAFSQQPMGEITVLGAPLVQLLGAFGGPTNFPYTLQWWKDGTNQLANQTNAWLNLTNLQYSDQGAYTLVSYNGQYATSSVAQITVMDPAPLESSVVTPVAGWASSTWSPANSVDQLFNNSGLSGTVPILTDTHDFQGSGYTMWTADGQTVTNTWLIFDLGAQYDLSGAAIWQCNHGTRPYRGWRTFGIYSSPDLVTPLTNYLGLYTLNVATSSNNVPVQLLFFPAGPATNAVRRLMFACTNIWETNATEYSELSEVRFLGTPSAISIANQPQGASLFVGDPYTFSVTTVGGTPFGYQWYKDSNLVAGATNATLTISSVQTGDSGNYTVVVLTNITGGAITSGVAGLVVQAAADVTSGLLGHWKLDETTGTLASDASLNGNQGTVYDVPGDDSQWIAGQIGGAMALFGPASGNSNYIIVPSYAQPPVSMSFSAWVWADSANPKLAGAQIAGNWGTTNKGQFLVNLGSSGKLQVTINEATVMLAASPYSWNQQTNGLRPVVPYTPSVSVSDTIALPLNSWQHVGFVADGTTLRLYRNGIQVAATDYAAFTTLPLTNNNGIQYGMTNFTGTLIASPISAITIGARGPDVGTQAKTNFWQGKIDDIALWARALAPNEFASIYAAGGAGADLSAVPSYPTTAPIILQQPSSSTNYLTDSPTLTVQVAGTMPYTYQWMRGSTVLATTTDSSLTLNSLALTNVQLSDAGTYSVIITNAGGSITSTPAILTIQAPASTTNDISGAAGLTPYSTKTWGTYGTTNNVTTGGVLQLCSAANQSSSVVFDETAGASGHIVAQWVMSTTAANSRGAAFTLLNANYYGSTGNPFLGLSATPSSWGTYAWFFTNSISIGFNVFNTAASSAGAEVSLFWNNYEYVIKTSPFDFRQGSATFVPIKAEVTYVPGGANVSVWVNSSVVYSNYFLAGPTPYPARAAFEANTSTTAFTCQVKNLNVAYDTPGLSFPAPITKRLYYNAFAVENAGLMTNYVDLPDAGQSFARVILSWNLGAAPRGIDAWDRIAQLFVFDETGDEYEIFEGITGYSTVRTWYVDLTDYLPLLRGKHKRFMFELFTPVPDGTVADGYGFLNTLDLSYYPGTNALTPFKVQNVWRGPHDNDYGVLYGVSTAPDTDAGQPSILMQNFFTPVTVPIDAGAQQVKWKSMVTGHGQGPNTSSAAEFFQSWNMINVNGTRSYSNFLWKADNTQNPTGTQSGTWSTSRAGWGPGCVVNGNGSGGWETNITAAVTPGQNATISYTYKPYVNSNPQGGNCSRYVVTAQLVSYRSTLLGPTITFLAPSQYATAADCALVAPAPDLTGSNFIVVLDDVSPITISQNPPPGALLSLGTNAIVLTASDLYGASTNATINVIVTNATPPISVLGANPLTNEVLTPFVDPGASLNDSCTAVVALVATNSTVNPNVVGTYTIQYIAMDLSGNFATNGRTVKIVDTTPPLISLNGPNPLTVVCHDAFSDPGASANDAYAGPVLVTPSGSVNTSVLGTYLITYNASDPSSNVASVVRTVNVVAAGPPVITWSFTNLTLSAGSNCQAVMPDVTGTNYLLASDDCSPTLLITQTPTNNSILELNSTNQVVITVADSLGNAVYSTNTVIVADTTPPVITLLGDPIQTNECHSIFVDLGVTATDNCSGIASLQTNGVVDPYTPGRYALQYVATDSAGNSSTNTRQVYVMDTTAPAITNPVPDQILPAGASLPDLRPLLGASDACSATLTILQFPVPGEVFPPGTVSNLVFLVDDGNGNTNTSTSTFTVLDPVPPVITSSLLFNDGSFKFTFTGPEGQTYQVLMGTDLTSPPSDWTILGNGAFGPGPATFVDEDATNSPARFYRIMSP
jgi:hypothetical protein